MLVEIIHYSQAKGKGQYKTIEKTPKVKHFTYHDFEYQTMVPKGKYAKFVNGKLREVEVGFFRRLKIKLRGK